MNILVISNDQIGHHKKGISSNFNDTVNILEAIGLKFKILLVSRFSQQKQSFFCNLKNNYTVISNIFGIKKYRFKIFMISITPRNFLIYLFISFFGGGTKGYVYLRSDGLKEYKTKIGYIGYFIYYFMLKIIKKRLKVISVSKEIYHSKKKYILTPSELSQEWFKGHKIFKHKKLKILYVGRYRKEKGIFSLLKLIKKMKIDFQLDCVGDDKKINIDNPNVRFLGKVQNYRDLIKIYDQNDIFILPSFTEGAPKVIIESLARLKPVIIFNEIRHVKKKFKGIFLCSRKPERLEKKIIFIINNYNKIIKDIKSNNLPTKANFQKELINIIND